MTFYGLEIATEVRKKAREDNSFEGHFPIAAESFDSQRNKFDLDDLTQGSNLYAWWNPNTGCQHDDDGLSYIMRADSRARKPGHYCQYCSMAEKSALEGAVFEYVRSVTPSDMDVLISMRILPTGPGVSSTEIDIYIPALRIGFEVNGRNHGAVKYYPAGYHEGKTQRAADIGIDLHHIWYKDLKADEDKVFTHIKDLIDQAISDKGF